MGAKSRADISPEIRGGLKRCFKIMADSGKPISSVWVALFESDPATAMRLAISLLPKELEIDQKLSTTININTNHLADEVFGELMRQAQIEQSSEEVH